MSREMSMQLGGRAWKGSERRGPTLRWALKDGQEFGKWNRPGWQKGTGFLAQGQ